MSFANNKRIIITGANSGIGLETARKLSFEAKKLILICRSRDRGDSAVKDLLDADHNCEISLVTADLSSAESIHSAVQIISKRYDSLDILINNAGGIFFRRLETQDGLEYTFGLNHMGYFRLTKGLMPLLYASKSSRIINVASAAHRYAALNFSDLQHKKFYQGFLAYSRSKLANILFTRESAKRLLKSHVSAVCLHPGFVRSQFARSTGNTLGGALFLALNAAAGIPPSEGAETPAFLARADALVNGGYYSNEKLIKPSKSAQDEDAAQKLWSLSEDLS